MEISHEAYALLGALVGAFITFVTTLITQRGQHRLEKIKIDETRAQLVFKETSEKVHQLATDLSALAYAFLWITWGAHYDDLDQKALQKYWDQALTLMPRLYGDYVLIAGIDDELGELVGTLVDQADKLDVAIGEATLNLSKKYLDRLSKLHSEAEAFANAISDDLAAALKRKRLVTQYA